MLLVLEDLHWADSATEDLVRFLLRTLAEERVLVVATWREDEPTVRTSLQQLVGELGRSDRAERVDVGPLTAEETSEQVRGIVGEAAATATAAWVHARAEGNPFFAEELLAAAAVGETDEVPEQLRRVLLARFKGLSPTARDVLGVVAAAGRDVGQGLLAAASGLDDSTMAAALHELVDAHVLVVSRAEERYAFRHALAREAVYDELLPPERVIRHRALARALESAVPARDRSAADWAALASHWAQARDRPAALQASLAAARAATSVHAFDAALLHLQRARELWAQVEAAERPAEVDEPELLRRLAEAARLAGRREDAIPVAEAALALVEPAADPRRAAELHHLLGRLHRAPERSIAHHETALALLPKNPSQLRAAILLSLTVARGYGTLPSVHGRWAAEALDMARAAGARAEEGRAHNELGLTLAYGGDPEGSISHFHDAIGIAAALGHAEDEVSARGDLADALLLFGRYEEALAVAEVGLARAGALGLASSRGVFVALNAADAELRLGRWADVAARVGVLLRADISEDDRLATLGYAIALAARRGTLDEGSVYEGEAVALLDANVGPQPGVIANAARAELALARGDPAAVRAIVDDTRRRVPAGDLLGWPALINLGLRAEADLTERARAGGGEVDTAAAMHYEREVHWYGYEQPVGERAPPETVAQWELADAELARVEGTAVPDQWAGIAQRWDALSYGYHAAYARLREAQARLATPDRAGAADALRTAFRQAAELGAAPLRTEIEALARRARIVLERAPARARPFDLTERELTVLERLATGSTNRRIADELFLSTRTVDMHVRNILSKLNAANRVEAAAIAHRHRLRPTGNGDSANPAILP